MKRILTLTFLTLIFLTALSAASYASCIRCNSGLDMVCAGESKMLLLSKCGIPDYSEELGEDTTARASRGKLTASTERTEMLYYNCGDGQFIKEIKIRGGKIVSIRENDRGSGSSRCI